MDNKSHKWVGLKDYIYVHKLGTINNDKGANIPLEINRAGKIFPV